MNFTYPIRDYKDVQRLKNYYLERSEYRNYLLITTCLNTALRISDVLNLKWSDILDSRNRILTHIIINEEKTGNSNKIFINDQIKYAVRLYIKNCPKGTYVFDNGKGRHITREYAYMIVKNAGIGSGIGGAVSCHSLRKTFGYHAWKKGIPPLLMEIYNHSSYTVTKRYLGIIQEDKDTVFNKIKL